MLWLWRRSKGAPIILTPSLSSRGSFSISKGGNIRIGICNFTNDLFVPLNDPSSWASCDDATSYTWENDFENEIGQSLSQSALLTHSRLPFSQEQIEALSIDWILSSSVSFFSVAVACNDWFSVGDVNFIT
jgi:hypothetical protein